MKSWNHIFLIAIVVITVLSLLLSACGPIDKSNGNSNKEKTKDKVNGDDQDISGNANKITICHKTGSEKKPFVEITVSVHATTEGHGTHEADLISAPEGGCPSSVIATEAPAE